MAIAANLQQFKSSGVYRLEFDKSQTVNIPAETIRLVVGFSKKGPFNTPVFVPDVAYFTKVFGEIDKGLERKGSWFHRSCITCLDRGPIIVLNLLSLSDTDRTGFRSISTSANVWNGAVSGPTGYGAPLSGYYNQDKFWYLDAAETLRNIDTYQLSNQDRLLNFANVGRKTISILTKKSSLAGYDVLATEWYGSGGAPEFMDAHDYMSDYMIDVIIVEGDFTNYQQLSNDPIFGNYFTTAGLKKTYTDQFGTDKDGISAFLSLPEVNILGVYSGSLIPDFLDKEGNNLFIEDQINLETSSTGLICAVQKEWFDDYYMSEGGDSSVPNRAGVDIIGHTIESDNVSIIDFLSYYGTIKSDRLYAPEAIPSQAVGASAIGVTGVQGVLSASTTLQSASGYTAGQYDTIQVIGPYNPYVIGGTMSSPWPTTPAGQASFETFIASLAENVSYIGCTAYGSTGIGIGYNRARVTDVVSGAQGLNTDYVTLRISLIDQAGSLDGDSGYLYLVEGTVTIYPDTQFLTQVIQSGDGKLYATYNNDLYSDWADGIITTGDKAYVGSTGGTLKWVKFTNGTFTNTNTLLGTGTAIYSHNINYIKAVAYEDAEFTTINLVGGFPAGATQYGIQTLADSVNEGLEIMSYPTTPTVVKLDNGPSGPLGLDGFSGKVKKGQYLVRGYETVEGSGIYDTNVNPTTGKSTITRITSVSENTDPLSPTYKQITITTVDAIYVSGTGATSDPYTVERYKGIESFVSNYHFTALKGFTLTENHMPNNTNTRMNEILDVMYNTKIKDALCDREVITFRYIVDTFNHGIEPYSKARLARISKDRMSSFSILNIPSIKEFKDSTNPLFKDSADGRFASRYIADGGNLDFNPSNVYSLPTIADGANYCGFYGPNLRILEKGKQIYMPPAAHVSNLFIDKYNTALPWSIVAGPRRGIVSGPGIIGVEYNFDRDDLDYIEPFGINAICNKRGFGLVINANQTAQQNIKSALSQVHVRELLIYIQDGIEAILKNYRWEFNTSQNRLEIKTLADSFLGEILNAGGLYDFQNIMDTTNNTSEIIDAQYGILDSYIEPVKGMGILVHRTTILKTGVIQTGNFL